jgi:hypothetical protein
MGRAHDDFVLKANHSLKRPGVTDPSGYHWAMIDRKVEGGNGNRVSPYPKRVPVDAWLFEDISGAEAPRDYASISKQGETIRPLSASDNGPVPSRGEELFVIENINVEA